jgi:ABC-type lipoprotein release transport system permease subunit
MPECAGILHSWHSAFVHCHSADDPLVLTLVASAMAVVSVIAGTIPAINAVRTDPVRVLRCE